MFFYTLTLFFFCLSDPVEQISRYRLIVRFFFLSVEEPSSFSRSLKKNGVKGSGGIALSSKILGRTKFRSLEIFERSEKNIPRVLVNGIARRGLFRITDLPVACPSPRRPLTNPCAVSISRSRNWSSGSYTRGTFPLVS